MKVCAVHDKFSENDERRKEVWLTIIFVRFMRFYLKEMGYYETDYC